MTSRPWTPCSILWTVTAVLMATGMAAVGTFLHDPYRVSSYLHGYGNVEQRRYDRRRLENITEYGNYSDYYWADGLDGNSTGDPIATVTVDFFRSYRQGFILPQYSISRWRCTTLLAGLNFWFAGRVQFELGNIEEFESDAIYEVDGSACNAILDLVEDKDDSQMFNKGRLSVVVSKKLNGVFGCRARNGQPLFGKTPMAVILQSGIVATAGATLANAVGRAMGLEPVGLDREEGVREYNQCGLDLKYPYFKGQQPSDKRVVGDDGTVYLDRDWRARVNLMNQFQWYLGVWAVVSFQFGLFTNLYAPVFEQIIACWKEQSDANEARGKEDIVFDGWDDDNVNIHSGGFL